jgi:hypothetical protein
LDKLGEPSSMCITGKKQCGALWCDGTKDSAFEGLLALDKSLMESDEPVGDKIVRCLPPPFYLCRPVPPVALFAPRLDFGLTTSLPHALGSASCCRHFLSSHRHGRHLRRVFLTVLTSVPLTRQTQQVNPSLSVVAMSLAATLSYGFILTLLSITLPSCDLRRI